MNYVTCNEYDENSDESNIDKSNVDKSYGIPKRSDFSENELSKIATQLMISIRYTYSVDILDILHPDRKIDIES